jgi:hypothetical protein
VIGNEFHHFAGGRIQIGLQFLGMRPEVIGCRHFERTLPW